jgi:hypothetical protein
MTDQAPSNADSFRTAAKALREAAAAPRYLRYAHAHNLMADSLEQQAATLDSDPTLAAAAIRKTTTPATR